MSLASLAYRIAAEPDFIERVRQSPQTCDDYKLLSDEEQKAVKQFIAQSINSIRSLSLPDLPKVLENGWWLP